MKRFIDINSGTVFEAGAPYTFWFEEGQSTNLQNTMPILFLSDTQNVSVTIEEGQNVFWLLDATKFADNIINMYGNDYVHLNKLSGSDYIIKQKRLTSTGVAHNNLYIHCIYILAASEEAGQMRTTFTLDSEQFNLGADFYNIDERLKSSMENFGLEIPESIQRAVYDENVHEEAIDNILLNRKWKELLLEYWNIIANKGSYNSLINAMKWFEYGDIVRVMEYWKRDDSSKSTYIGEDLQKTIGDLTRRQLLVKSKSTFVSLDAALQKVTEHFEDEKSQFSGNSILPENNPVLESVILKWTVADMMLKMALFGSFYATFFMPIHIDLMHSCIESIIYTNAIKVLNFTNFSRLDNEDLCTVALIDCDKYKYITPVKCYVNPTTIFGITNFHFEGDTIVFEPGVLGVDLEPNEDDVTAQEAMLFSNNLLNTFGAIVNFECKIQRNINDGDFIKLFTVNIYKDGEHFLSKTCNNVTVSPETTTAGTTEYKFTFNILLEEEGHYDFVFQFVSAASFIYSCKASTVIEDDAHCSIDLYRLRRKAQNSFSTIDFNLVGAQTSSAHPQYTLQVSDIRIVDGIIDNHSMIHEGEQFSQFISCNNANDTKSVGLNHTLIFRNNDGITFKCNGNSYNSTTVRTLDHYWWLQKTLAGETFIIGIRKFFSIDAISNILHRKQYKSGESVYDVEIIQSLDSVNVLVAKDSVIIEDSWRDLQSKYEIDLGEIVLDVKVTTMDSEGSNVKGLEKWKVVPQVTEIDRIVNEDRFYALFHKLEPLGEHFELGSAETVVCIPNFKSTKGVTDFVWQFDRLGDDGVAIVDTLSSNNVNPIIAHRNTPLRLQKGYYNIIANYKYSGEQKKSVLHSAIKIN